MLKGVGRGWFRRKKGKLVYYWYNDAGNERTKVIGDTSTSDEQGWIAVAKLKLNEQVGRPDPNNATFGEVLQAWLKNSKSKTGAPKAPSTRSSDECHAKHLERWANRVAKDLHPLEVQQWLDGKSYGIRAKLRSLMSGVFRLRAEGWDDSQDCGIESDAFCLGTDDIKL